MIILDLKSKFDNFKAGFVLLIKYLIKDTAMFFFIGKNQDKHNFIVSSVTDE